MEVVRPPENVRALHKGRYQAHSGRESSRLSDPPRSSCARSEKVKREGKTRAPSIRHHQRTDVANDLRRDQKKTRDTKLTLERTTLRPLKTFRKRERSDSV